MSNEQITRQRRIVSLVKSVQTADRATIANPTTLPTTRRLERFQRTLLSPILTQPTLLGRLAEDRLQPEASPAIALKQIKPDELKVGAESDNNHAIDPHADVMVVSGLVDEISKHREYSHETMAADSTSAPTTAVPTWVAEFADLISQTCSQADQAFSHWSVVVPLDPVTLPDTTLRLDLSPSRLLLRFCTQSTHSQRLISLHSKNLIALLVDSISQTQNIEIDVT